MIYFAKLVAADNDGLMLALHENSSENNNSKRYDDASVRGVSKWPINIRVKNEKPNLSQF